MAPMNTGVTCITIYRGDDDHTVRMRIHEALAGAPAGEYVRLKVPAKRPPALIHHYCDPRYLWQIEAPDFATKQRWMDAITGKALHV